jgi:hypothetical protein
MKNLLSLLGSEGSLISGAIGSLSDRFGWNRAVVRIAGLLIILIAPYLLGASIRQAWWISILIYIGLGIIARKGSCAGRHHNSRSARRREARNLADSSNRNQSDKNSQVGSAISPPEKDLPNASRISPRSEIGDNSNFPEGQFADALSDLEKSLARLDQRIQKMESAVTDRSYDWDRRLRRP